MRGGLALLVLAAVAWAPPGAEADEKLAGTQSVLAALPAPAMENAWEFRGYVLRDGRPYGRVTLSGGPQADQSERWLVRDEIVPLKPQDFATLQTAVLDRRLQALSGTYHRRNTGGFLRARYEALADRYRVEHESDYYENRIDVPGERGLATLAGLITFLRHVPAEPAVYTLREFDPEPSGGDPYAMPARIQIHGRAGWRVARGTREAWIASFTRGKQTLRLAFEQESRELLGVDYVGVGVQLVPEGSGPVGLADDAVRGLATPIELAVERTAKERRKLGLPQKSLSFLGTVSLDGHRVGSVMLSAEPASVAGAPAWRVLESQTIKVGEAVIEHEISGFLSQDLTVLKGERIDKRPEGVFHVTYRRKAGGMETVAHTPDGPQPPVLLAAPDGAMAGLVPLLLFLRGVPETRAHYVLPGWDPRFAQKPKAGTGTFTLRRSDMHVHVDLTGPLNAPSSVRRLVARCVRRDGLSFDVILQATKRRRLLAVRGVMPRVDLQPRKLKTQQLNWYDAVEGTPRNWRQAFVKFGRGYHRPRRDLLADAFHWPSMVKHALAEKRYEPGTSEEQIRKDWIDVFVGMSKHRTKGDCDDLLFQIFMTSKETEHADLSVSLTTLPAYGGHTYRMRELDGRWWIVQID